MLVVEHQLAEQLDLLNLIGWRCHQPLERLCLDAVDLGLDLRNFRKCCGRERCAGFLRAHHIGAERGHDGDRFEHQSNYQRVHPARLHHQTLRRRKSMDFCGGSRPWPSIDISARRHARRSTGASRAIGEAATSSPFSLPPLSRDNTDGARVALPALPRFAQPCARIRSCSRKGTFFVRRRPRQMRCEGRVADAVGRLMSAFWILSANSWMQTPVGYEMRDGIAYPVDRLDIVFNPSFPYRVAHMVISASRRK